MLKLFRRHIHNDCRKIDLFIFLTGFARAFIEIFMPVLLYKMGFSVKEILLYYVVISLASAVAVPLLTKLARHTSIKLVLALAPITFCATFLALEHVPHTTWTIALIAILHMLFRKSYWIPRHYLVLNKNKKKDMTTRSKWFTILETVSGMIATFMGAVVIDIYGITAGILFAGTVFFLGCMPAWRVKVQSDHHKKDNYRRILRRIPKRSLLVLALVEFRWIAGLLFPLYIFINIEDELTFIGSFQVLIGMASIVAVYCYGHIMDKLKSDLMRFAALGLAMVFLLKLNVFSPIWFLGIALLEGLFSRFYQTSYVRNVYALGKDYNAREYQSFYLVFTSVVAAVLLGSFYLLNLDLVVVLYVCVLGAALSGLVDFDDGRGGY